MNNKQELESVIAKARTDEREIIHNIIIITVPNTVIRLWLSKVMNALKKTKS